MEPPTNNVNPLAVGFDNAFLINIPIDTKSTLRRKVLRPIRLLKNKNSSSPPLVNVRLLQLNKLAKRKNVAEEEEDHKATEPEGKD
ncbi:unnamed protein product [Phytophthora fragariaefolia]|uniref:Unnamed protein product n=1 Tax=Phytophthora fragariaefolia TaxID=1490495 RepID=A0A9W6YE36_9STRA|nr:unnamed protein product [Phytophthora fragariaefolia]